MVLVQEESEFVSTELLLLLPPVLFSMWIETLLEPALGEPLVEGDGVGVLELGVLVGMGDSELGLRVGINVDRMAGVCWPIEVVMRMYDCVERTFAITPPAARDKTAIRLTIKVFARIYFKNRAKKP